MNRSIKIIVIFFYIYKARAGQHYVIRFGCNEQQTERSLLVFLVVAAPSSQEDVDSARLH